MAFGLRAKSLTCSDVEKGFPEGSVIFKLVEDEDRLIFSLDPSISPYGEFGKRVFFSNPVLPCQADGSLEHTDLMKYDLFRGGFLLEGWESKSICQMFTSFTQILGGNYDTEDGTFTVSGNGAETHNSEHLLLIYERVDGEDPYMHIRPKLITNALCADSFQGRGRNYDIFVFPLYAVFNRNGNPDKKRESHIRVCLQDITERSFAKTFSHTQLNDGVNYRDAWVIDGFGREIPPTDCSTTSDPRTPDIKKRWTDLSRFDICLSCTICFDGSIKLSAVRCYRYEPVSPPNELQRRRMYIIRQKIIRDFNKIFSQYKPILTDEHLEIPEWGELEKIN